MLNHTIQSVALPLTSIGYNFKYMIWKGQRKIELAGKGIYIKVL